MDLQETYKKESGYDVGRYKIDNTNYYSEDYVEWLEKQLHISSVNHCTCTPDETTGTTTVKCCNICGKPAESFWLSGSCSAIELEEMKRLAHEGLPDDCVKGWDEVKFCENRQGNGDACKWCSNYR